MILRIVCGLIELGGSPSAPCHLRRRLTGARRERLLIAPDITPRPRLKDCNHSV
jgi:hypothetical protein